MPVLAEVPGIDVSKPIFYLDLVGFHFSLLDLFLDEEKTEELHA